MIKHYKYKWLMDRIDVGDSCPHNDSEEKSITAYRWTFSDIDNEDNFLPNIIFNEKRGHPPRINDKSGNYFKCSTCGLSMFSSLEFAISKMQSIPKRGRDLLGYTHVAKGDIFESDGQSGIVNHEGHFDFFEYSNVNLAERFTIIDSFD